MFQQIPAEVVAAIIENAGEMYLNRLAERKMAQLNYELLLRLGSAILDEPWAEGEEGENGNRAKESTVPESDRPSDISKEEIHIKTEPCPENSSENEEDMSPKVDTGATHEEENSETCEIKTEPNEDLPIIPKVRKNSSEKSGSKEETEEEPKRKSSLSMGNMESMPEKRRSVSRGRGSNLGDSSEVEHSETDETDDRRISSRREQEFGSGTPDRPGSEFGGSPSPFSAQQQQQILQASIPYLHLLPPHIRNDAARLFLMPQMLPPELAAAAAAAAAATSTSNQSPSPGSGGNVGSGNTSQTITSSSQSNSKSEKSIAGENPRTGTMFMCDPCNIKFSSAKTLEAHQTYYCSFRKDAGREGVRIEGEDKSEMLMSVGSGSSSVGSKKRDRENSEEQEMIMDESIESMDSFSGSVNHNKSHKTGKLYSCVYCSYSADKKVSLNRHMRMHSGSGLSISANQMPNTKDEQGQMSGASASLGSRPVTPGKSPSASVTPTPSSSKNIQEGVSAMERYCQDCDIQFSSIKTFRVHKQYYCSTRHVLKAQQTAVAAAVAAAGVLAGNNVSAALGKAPVELGPGVTVTPVGKSSASVGSACSPIPGEGSPASTPGPMGGQPFVVLPTNPIIVVPYCFIQGASFIPGNVMPSQNAIVVLPNGTVQSLPSAGGGTGSVGIPIPAPSPSPQSMILGSHLMLHSPFPTSVTPGPSSIMSPNNLSFHDPKEMMKLMNNGAKEDGEMMMSPNKLPKSSSRNSGRSSRSSEEATDQHNHHHPHASKGHSATNETCDDGSMPAIDLTFRGIQPKKESSNGGGGGGGDDEKENREENCSSVGSRNSRNVSRDSIPGALEENSRSRSATPATSLAQHGTSVTPTTHHSQHDSASTHQRDRESPLEKMSMGSGSGGKRTPRPSSASVSSSCSTPPALCEPKINGMMSQMISPGGKDSQDPTTLNNKMVMMMLNASAAAAAAALENSASSRGKKGSVDYSSMTRSSRGSTSGQASGVNGGKISPMATQLPGGAILTSATSNQSLAELLMTNPPELNESLAKLNPQLLMNAHRAAAAAAATGSAPVGFNFNLNPAFLQALNPEIAMRLLDPTYLSTLQQSLQQQQQQQQTSSTTTQATQGPVKRGVSKCIECDIVFYKTENYLVHKEYYCAARANTSANASGGSNIYPPQSKTPTASTSRGKLSSRDNGSHHRSSSKDASRMSSCSSPSKSELEDDECISPPPPMHRKISSGSLRKSPDSSSATISSGVQSMLANKPKSKSPQNAISSPNSVSPVPSPKSFGVGVITSHNTSGKDDGKTGGSLNQYPCSICGVKFSTVDNLQTHQAFYCNKRKGLSYGENNGESTSGESKSGNNNGDAFMLELLASAPNSQSTQEKDMISAAQAIGLASSGSRNKSPGPGVSCRNGFLRCGKCKLPIPEEQMSTHIRVCLGTVSPSFGNGRGSGGGGEMGGSGGWKCPCCDVYSPTVSAAQKHLETHTGIRAFKCLLCGYRGNTLRGMRTHIRTHFDKRVFDLLEGDYMTCITANDVEPNSSSSAGSSHNSIQSEQIHRAIQSPNTVSGAINRGSGGQNEISKTNNGKSLRYSPEMGKNVSQAGKGVSVGSHAEDSMSPNSASYNEDGNTDMKVFQSPTDMMMMTMMTENDSNTTNNAENNNQLHYCNLCNYSSPFKANILKHMKLVHKVQIPLDMGEAEAAAMMLMHSNAAAAGGEHEGLSMSLIMNRAGSEGVGLEDLNGDSRNSTPKTTLEYAMAQGFSITPDTGLVTTRVKSLSPAGINSEIVSTRSSSRRGGGSTTTTVPNGTSGIAVEIKEEVDILRERKCSSHSSAEDDIGKPEKYSTAGTGSTSAGGNGNATANYCKSCDISFNYVSSFNAHKKFYCSSVVSSSDTETTERAETPVQ